MATKIDIISGFLGAGKTTLIKKLLKEAYADEQVVLIENEFGEIGIDGGFLKEAGIQIREMNSGCICCSLVGDFGTSLKEVVDKYHPDRILIEPSGVGKLSDVIKAVQGVQGDVDIVLNSYTTVVDAKKCKMYMRNFGEFFNNQVEYAGAIIMSRTDIIDEKKAQQAMELLRGINAKAAIITTPIEKLDGKKILEVMEKPVSLEEELMSEEEVCPECGHVHEHGEHHHHDHDHDHECGCGHDHEEHEHHHHHHDDDHCGCGCEIMITNTTSMNIITITMTTVLADVSTTMMNINTMTTITVTVDVDTTMMNMNNIMTTTVAAGVTMIMTSTITMNTITIMMTTAIVAAVMMTMTIMNQLQLLQIVKEMVRQPYLLSRN